jgi:hypothetical protein
MPLPATWHTLPHVGAAGRQRPSPPACTYPQVGGLLRGGEPMHRPTGYHLRAEVQRRILSALPGATAHPSPTWQAPGLAARQRQVPPCPRAPTLVAPTPQATRAIVLTALQSRAQSHRTGLEADASLGYPQSTLPNAGGHSECRTRALRALGKTESAASSVMRHYLSRCI